MTDLALSLIIDDQEVDFEVAAAAVTDIVSAPQFTAVVAETPGVDVEVASPPTVDVSTLTQPFTVITVEGPPGQTGPPGNGVFIARETPTELVDGSRTKFTLAHSFQPGSTSVYLNGVLEFFCDELSPNQIQFSDPPHPGDMIRVSYTVSG
jgi:hypothetical protein